MTRQWVNPLIRCFVYLYFAAGIALLVSGGMASAIRYQADKRVPATILFIVFGGILFFLAFGNWETFRRPICSRKWILLCLLSSLGLLLLLFAPTSYGASGV